MRRAEDSRPSAHPGSLVGNYAATEAHRRHILNGNGTQEDHDHDTEDDSQEDGWTTF
ncbi:hypothetical protein [Streptomyces sp. NPDC045251]|uniref:hypothetical protein n=1 Tax=unclassified Streptomyces TaxID=2593676 RepID=UPI0033E051A9